MLDKFFDLFAENEVRPNKFTIYMGERIRTAREEAGLSQEELAKKVYLRRATLSDIENGKSEANTGTFVLLAYVLMKPLAYFLPPFMYDELKKEDLSPAENEVITQLRYHVVGDQFRKLVVDIIKAIGKFDVDHFVMEEYQRSKMILEEEERMKQYEERRKKK